MKQINIKDLAKSLGISKSTVSRAFRDNSDIKPETKVRILAAAEELGYRPNLYASNLRGAKGKTIAIIIPEFGNNFFSQAIKGIEEQARAKGYYTLIFVTDDDVEKESTFIKELCNGRVEGVLMSASGEGKKHNYLRLLKERNIPLVFFDRYYEDVEAPVVTGNDYESSYAATKHLLDLGCKRPAYLVVDKNISIGKIRMQGYCDALKDAGIDMLQELIIECGNDKGQIYRVLKKSFAKLRPDGIFASVERLAMPMIRICHEEQVAIPEQLKIICFSCLEFADMLNPALSTVQQPAMEMGRTAAQILFELLQGNRKDDEPQIILLPSKLIPQKSTIG
ncbi:LacI family DNA-binding transcriptional regulator [Olivibacter sitiensis]|uniref:LacI family DNA-binding transcriptional regulator n=1 Tax=Olivibacter sitiensis TaxID=376470 RepID=UPI000481CEBE|nr:LacI family DNA-binding transcriptional regulator [Olivibacter sitiensis]